MKLVYSFADQSHSVALDRSGDDVKVELDGARVHVSKVDLVPPRVTFFFKDKPVTAYVVRSGSKRWVHVGGKTLVLDSEQAGARHARIGGARDGIGSGVVVAPMPGQVRAVLVQEGDQVTEAQPLMILEAMKMELKVLAPHDGVMFKLNVAPGAGVERDQILGEIKERT